MALTVQRSIDLLLKAQTPSGAIPASTGHPIYQYGWLRDGSWCAYALDVAGQTAAATEWHQWVARTLLAHEHRVDEAIASVAAGTVNGAVMMPARFTLDGREEEPGDGEEEWPNFQTDCYGFWLWALADHIRRGATFYETLRAAARLVVRYLVVVGETPCFDCWEEHPGRVHTSSIAAVAAGLRDVGRLLEDSAAIGAAGRLIARMTGHDHVLGEAFIRSPGDTRVDGSLLWLAVPFRLVDVDNPIFANTVSRIRDELIVADGGPYRYLGDTFFGGSEWILLAASYGCVARELGDLDTAHAMLAWIESAATAEGHLPEQVQDHVQSPYMLTFWRNKWGATATPLLWSHAMHVVLADVLGQEHVSPRSS